MERAPSSDWRETCAKLPKQRRVGVTVVTGRRSFSNGQNDSMCFTVFTASPLVFVCLDWRWRTVCVWFRDVMQSAWCVGQGAAIAGG